MTGAAKYKPEFCEIAIRVLSDGESLAAVCDELDIGRTTLYEWRDKHEEFKEALEKGLQKAQRDWEKIGKKGITGEYDKFGGSAWIFTMKNRFRNDYKEDKADDKGDPVSLLEKIISGEVKVKE